MANATKAYKRENPLQITYGDMGLGDVYAKVSVDVVAPNSKLKQSPARVFVSDAPIAKAPASAAGISGCGEWRSHVLKGEGVQYLRIASVTRHGITESTAMFLRVHQDAPIQVIHVQIPQHSDSTIINGKVMVFTGRADILTLDEVNTLGFHTPSKMFVQDEEEAENYNNFHIVTMEEQTSRHVQTTTEMVEEDGKVKEVIVRRRRRRVRVRK